jgi:hypothetical protein
MPAIKADERGEGMPIKFYQAASGETRGAK